MAFTVHELATHPRLHATIREQSRALLGMHGQNPRLSSVFATQQRWLLGHAGLTLFFLAKADEPRSGLFNARFLDFVEEHRIASRNTADAFLKEMIHYHFIRYVPGVTGRRMRPLEPSEQAIVAVGGWLAIHLSTLDALDCGNRAATFLAEPTALARIQPEIAFGLLKSPAVREPQDTFSLFTWLNNGGVVMDSLIAGIAETDPDADRVATDVQSVADLAGRLTLSRTHLTRKLRAAEDMGSLGWMGKRGQSVMWVSNGFRQEYAMAQAVKLSIVDAGFSKVMQSSTPRSRASVEPMQLAV